MAAIVPLHGKTGVFTVNGATVRLTRISVKITNEVAKFATTGQTADGDSNYWMNKLAGLNDAVIEADGYIDHHATPASRFVGDNIKFRPGTGAAGTLSIAFGTTHGFTGSAVVASIDEALDAEANKPDTFRVTLEIDGALTYVNS